MEESEDNMSSEDIKYIISPSHVRVKPKKRSLVERELETNLTARVTSPVSNCEATSTSRYGRARRSIMESETIDNKSAPKFLKSPKLEISPRNTVQSPVNKMHASNSPIRMKSPNKSAEHNLENQIENIYNENISLSRFGSAEKLQSPSKRYPKVYIRKDLIQSKDKDKDMDETVTLIKNIFSPVKSTQKSSSHKTEKSSEKHNRARMVQHGLLDSSVVKTLDFDSNKKIKKEFDKQPLSKNDIFEMEARCTFQVGDLAWARMGTYPFWPCIITREPVTGLFVKKKLFGRVERDMLHVTFFGDNGRRSWIVDMMLREFLGQLEFEVTRSKFTPETKKKDLKLYMAYFISEKKMPLWSISVEEAEMLLREPKRLRIELLNNMLLQQQNVKTPKVEKSKKIVRTDSDVSLSESLFDTLFSEDDCKISDMDRSRTKSRNKSLDVSEVVTACLDNMAAKTGITKIQRQSHMDRWLQKAKCKTPEKYQLNIKKTTSAKKKKQLPKILPSIKPYTFRKSASESPKSGNNLLSNQNEHDYSLTMHEKKKQTVDDKSNINDNDCEELSKRQSDIGFISKAESLYAKEQAPTDDVVAVETVHKEHRDINNSNNIESAVVKGDCSVTEEDGEAKSKLVSLDTYKNCIDNEQDEKAIDKSDCLNKLDSSISQERQLYVLTIGSTKEPNTTEKNCEIFKNECENKEKHVKGSKKIDEIVNAFNTQTLSNVFFNQDKKRNKTIDVCLSGVSPDNEIQKQEICLTNISKCPVDDIGNSETENTKNESIDTLLSTENVKSAENASNLTKSKIGVKDKYLVGKKLDNRIRKNNCIEHQPQDMCEFIDSLIDKNTVEINETFTKSTKLNHDVSDLGGSLNTDDQTHIGEMKDSHQTNDVVELNKISTHKVIRVIKNKLHLQESLNYHTQLNDSQAVKLNKLSTRKCIRLIKNNTHKEEPLNIVNQIPECSKGELLDKQKDNKKTNATKSKIALKTDLSVVKKSVPIEGQDISKLTDTKLNAANINEPFEESLTSNEKILDIQEALTIDGHAQGIDIGVQSNTKVIKLNKHSLRQNIRLNRSKPHMKEIQKFDNQVKVTDKTIVNEITIVKKNDCNRGRAVLTNDKLVHESFDTLNQTEDRVTLTDSQIQPNAGKTMEPYVILTKVKDNKLGIRQSTNIIDHTHKDVLSDLEISTKDLKCNKVCTRNRFRFDLNKLIVNKSLNTDDQIQAITAKNIKSNKLSTLLNTGIDTNMEPEKELLNVDDRTHISDKSTINDKIVKKHPNIKAQEMFAKVESDTSIVQGTFTIEHLQGNIEQNDIELKTNTNKINEPYLHVNKVESNKLVTQETINVDDQTDSIKLTDSPLKAKYIVLNKDTTRKNLRSRRNKSHVQESKNFNYQAQFSDQSTEGKIVLESEDNCGKKLVSAETKIDKDTADIEDSLNTVEQPCRVKELIDSRCQTKAVTTNESYDELMRLEENTLGTEVLLNNDTHTHKGEMNNSQLNTKVKLNKLTTRKHFRLSRNKPQMQESVKIDDQTQVISKTTAEDKIIPKKDDSEAVVDLIKSKKGNDSPNVKVLLNNVDKPYDTNDLGLQSETKFNETNELNVKLITAKENKPEISESSNLETQTYRDCLADSQRRRKDAETTPLNQSTRKIIKLNRRRKISLSLVDLKQGNNMVSQLHTKTNLHDSPNIVDQCHDSTFAVTQLCTDVVKTNQPSKIEHIREIENKSDLQRIQNFDSQTQVSDAILQLDTEVVKSQNVLVDQNEIDNANFTGNKNNGINDDKYSATNQNIHKESTCYIYNNNDTDQVSIETLQTKKHSNDVSDIKVLLNHRDIAVNLNLTKLEEKPIAKEIHCHKTESTEDSKINVPENDNIFSKSVNKIKNRCKTYTEDNNVLIDKHLNQVNNQSNGLSNVDIVCISSTEKNRTCVSITEKSDVREDIPLNMTDNIKAHVKIKVCTTNNHEDDLFTINDIASDHTLRTDSGKALTNSILKNSDTDDESKNNENTIQSENTIDTPEVQALLVDENVFDHTGVTRAIKHNSIKLKHSQDFKLEKSTGLKESTGTNNLEELNLSLNEKSKYQKNNDVIKNKMEIKKNNDLSIKSISNLKKAVLTNRIIVNGFHIEEELCLDEYSPSNIFGESNESLPEHSTNDIEKTDTYEGASTIVTETKIKETDPDCASITSEDSEMSLSRRKSRWKEKQMQIGKKKALEDPEFLKYLEFRQDSLIDENPELSQEEITSYLYKTWLYEENLKGDKKNTDEVDQTTLVKGHQEPMPTKKVRKKNKLNHEKVKEISEKYISNSSEEVSPKEKSKRAITQIRPFYTEDISDIEDEIELFEIFKRKPSPHFKKEAKDNKPNTEINYSDAPDNKLFDLKTEDNIIPLEVADELAVEKIDIVEIYFQQLTAIKPNLFKGLIREKVCEVCERVGNLMKCKTCHCMFHIDCVKNKDEVFEVPLPVKSRRKKKKRGRKPKNFDGTSTLDSGSQSDDLSQDANISEEMLNVSIESCMENNIVANADDFETQLEAKMKEILNNPDNLDYDSNMSEDVLDWSDTDPGKCEIVDIKPRQKDLIIAEDFKCNNCLKYNTPVCFVCKSAVSPTDKVEYRQRCQVAHCYQYYHLECLDHWPQTQFNAGERSRSNKRTEYFEAMSCPRHVCHTCVCDDPRGCKTRFSGDKLARCVRCPATYHTFTKCLPAGTQILTGSLIVCPRHYQHRPGKVPCHVNTGWCFICALGGTLICCEYCPTSFHAECLNIDPPEGGYMCEDCETGRLPLYGEMVWVKLGQYRWWPGIILHPSEIPDNIMAVRHSPGEFVVRFFGQYDHYWVNRGRVFPFQEGDSGKISSQRSKIDAAFTMAVEHAQRACQILKTATPNQEESQDIASSLLPPHYVKLKVNKPCGTLTARRPDLEESSLTQCECDPNDVEPCGPYSQCLNRMLLTECGPTCRAGERCNNRAFEKRLYPKMEPYRTPHRGWGLKALEEIKAGQFVIEYVGELISEDEFRRRMCRKHEVRDENFYFLTLDKERMIDAGPKGNLARFMNHSCEGNCETQKWTVLGDIRVGLFAINDIPANSELTFNYNLESTGIEKKRCMCGAKRCSGYIGAKPKQDEPQPKKNKQGVKKTNKKRKTIELSPTSKPKPKPKLGRPMKPREMTDIEKDLLIIKNATNAISSDSECSRMSIESKDSRGFKRKRIARPSEEFNLPSPSVKRTKVDVIETEQ